MIKTILFDLDNVLVDMSDAHWVALNKALRSCGYKEIPYDEHLKDFNGLPTKLKLQRLSDLTRISFNDHHKIWEAKQNYTIDSIKKVLRPDPEKIDMMAALIIDGYKLACVTNSIRKSAKYMLKYAGLYYYMSLLVSNEDVEKPKPHPEPYLKAMKVLKAQPSETLIVEDSEVGIKSATASKAHVMPVKNWKYVTHNQIYRRLRKYQNG